MIRKTIKRYYKIVVSGADDITVDEDEARIVIKLIESGQKIIKCREGMFNSSYFVEIVPDYDINDRISREMENSGYYDDKWYEPRYDSLEKLLGGPNQNKQLSDGNGK